jgi:hypothetical protein
MSVARPNAIPVTNLVLVPIHSCQSADVSEDILQCISELESIDIAETELDMSIDDELSEAKNFTTQMESISKARLFALFRSQSSDDIVNDKKAHR